jgi:hypothetical protein
MPSNIHQQVLDLPVPEDLEIKRTEDSLEFTLPFTNDSKFWIWFAALFWAGGVLIIYIFAIAEQEEYVFIGGFFHLLIGVFLVMNALASSYNTVKITVTRTTIEKHEGPVFVPFRRMHYSKSWVDVKKIYVDTVIVNRRTYDRLNLKTHYETDRMLVMWSYGGYLKVVMREIKSFLSEME